ncbi:MAG: PEP-CTERM sorting domain-containing protein [Armatimonadota bacterium]
MKRTSTIALAMSILAVASVANAQSLKFTGTQLGSVNSGTINVNGTTETVAMGALTFSTGSGSIVTYCADATSPLNSNSNPYSVGPVNMTNGTGLALAAKILASGFSSAISADQQQGLQLAVWDALYDNGASFNAGTGNMKVVSGVGASALSFASSYYSAGVSSSATSGVELFKASGAGGQDQLHVVPEPASLAVLGLGVFGLIRRRRTNK